MPTNASSETNDSLRRSVVAAGLFAITLMVSLLAQGLVAGANVLTVTNHPTIAPPTATRGQANVPIDLLNFSSNGPTITVDNISVNLAGTGSRNDITRVSLHVDNGDGVYSATTDSLLGTPSVFPPTGPAEFRNLAFAVNATVRSIWIVYDISPAATIGDRVGSRIASNASFLVSGGSVSGVFPLDSGLTTITGSLLTVAWTSLAPSQVRQGGTNVPMLRLTLSVNAGQATVTGFRVDRRGTATDADVPLAKFWLDNGDTLFGPGDAPLGQQTFVGGTAVIGGLALNVATGTDRIVFVTYNVSSSATVGATASARLAAPTYVSVGPNATVSPANFPILSAAFTIVAGGPGAILSVQSVDLAAATPQVSRGQTDVPMEKIVLTADANQATLSGVRVDKRGTSTLDSDVAAVKLYRDANGDGVFSTSDTLLGSSAFVAGTTVFSGLNVVVVAGQPVVLFITIDVASSATINATLAVRLGAASYLSVDANSTVDSNAFPIRSSDVTIVGTAPTTTPPGVGTDVLLFVGVAVVVVAALGIIVFALTRRKKHEEPKPSEPKPGAPP
jgi:hypothetical protein